MEQSVENEIGQLARFLDQAKREIYAIGPSGDGKKATGDATLHLDAVVKSTEEASHAIMDAADAITAAASGLGGEREQAISGAITRIYEACNFQDLTGQRVNKVIKILGEIDERISHIMQLFGAQGTPPAMPKAARSGDEALLNGPQLPDQAPCQDDIDALFGKP